MYAGGNGQEKAFVAALEMEPERIKIGDFKYKTNDLVKKYAVSHNDIEMDRGVWRKYNPYNPYVESEEEHPNNNIESLDDLFEEDEKKEENENKIVAEQTAPKEETKEVYDIQKELEE